MYMPSLSINLSNSQCGVHAEVYCNRGGVRAKGHKYSSFECKILPWTLHANGSWKSSSMSGGGQLTEREYWSSLMWNEIAIKNMNSQMLAIMQLSDACLRAAIYARRARHISAAWMWIRASCCGGRKWAYLLGAQSHHMKSTEWICAARGVDTSRYNCNNSIAIVDN